MVENVDYQGFKSGFVALLGRPNVGKSTLLNALLGSKISIISSVPQTTRHQIRGVLHLDKSQIVFVDTPGIHTFSHKLAVHLNSVARKTLEDIELILYVIDISRRMGKEEDNIMKLLAGQKVPIIVAFNKVDKGSRNLGQYMDAWQGWLQKEKIVKDPVCSYLPISALEKTNLEKLKELIVEELPEGPPFYTQDMITDFPQKLRAADIVREKLFSCLNEEVPHSLAVEVEEIEDKENVVCIYSNIYVNRTSQRQIILGKKGEFIKAVGIAARKDLEEMFKKKVFLQLHVKVMKDWQKRPRILRELGYC
jgi:GTPase